MRFLIAVIPITVLPFLLFHFANAEVYVPDNEYAGYFDSNGIYTVYGSVKNTEDQPVLTKVQVNVTIGVHSDLESRILPVIYPSKDMPFKFKFHQIDNSSPNLQKPIISFIRTNSNPLNLEVNYDKTLIRYPDGHLTGFITNIGNNTIFNVDVYALVHTNDNKFLDEVQSTSTIAQIHSSEKAKFVMFPDPTVAKHVTYYSCFIPGTDNSQLLSTDVSGKTFYFSILSIVYFSNQKFDENSNSIFFDASNPWQMSYYANIMFPENSGNGEFKVLIDGKEVKSLISKDDDTGNWHVAFNIDYGQHKVIISGFQPNFVPNSDEYFYLTPSLALNSWAGYSTFTISDAKMLEKLGIDGSYAPIWVKKDVGFVIYNNLPVEDVINAIKYLKERGIVR